MLFDACDAEKIATWRGEIESTINSLDNLRTEIASYFTQNGEHDPDQVLAGWNDIQTINDGDTLWGAFLGDNSAAKAAAESEGRTLTFGTPPDGYGNANWRGMELWYVA